MNYLHTIKEPTKFVVKVALIYALAYLVVGAIAYQLLTQQFYVGNDPIFTLFLRSETHPDQWAHVTQWQIPVLLLRSLLIALVLLPFATALRAFSFGKCVFVLFGLVFVLAHLAAGAPSPSNLEGIVYMRPELMSVKSFLLTQPEMIAQSLLFAIGTAYVIGKRSSSAKPPRDRRVV